MNKNKTIAIISPSKKYLSGIYHFTIKTALELKKYWNVKVISFKKQYPKFLYPGNLREENLSVLKIEDDYAILKWYDYFSWKNAFKIVKNHANIIYIPWWTITLAMPFLYLAKISKKHGIKVIIEFHNLFDHDAGKIKKFLSSLIINRIVKYSDLCIVHTKENQEKLNNLIKHDVNVIILPLGPLNDLMYLDNSIEIYEFYGLNKNKKYILMFGIVRKYKGLEYAIKAMKFLNKTDYSDYQLLVVGEIWINLRKEKGLIYKYGLEDNIIFIDKFIPDKHILPFFKIAEIIIYPYINATQSGSLNFALSATKPIIATTVGGFKEILKDQVNGLLIPPKDPYKLANAILKLIENPELAKKIAKNGYEYFQNNISWDTIIEKMLNAIRII